jgi:hypothetical protein
VFHVDDLVETGAEQIVVARFHLLLRSHLIPQNQCQKGITNWSKNESKTQENKRQNPLFLQFQLLHICRNVRQDKAARVFNGELDSGRMWRDGHVFHMSENGVWLTLQVPPDFICRKGAAALNVRFVS